VPRDQSNGSAQLEGAERAHVLFDALPIAVGHADSGHRITFANRTYRDIFGGSPDPVGRTLREVVGEETFAFVEPYLLRVLAGEEVAFERSVVRRDGSAGVRSVRYLPERDPSGKVSGYFALIEDITERKLIEQQLREERNFTSAVLDNAGALVMVLDREGRIVRFNHACEQLSGYIFAEVRGKHPLDTVLPAEDAETVRPPDREVPAKNPRVRTGRYTNHWVSRNGVKHLIEWHNTLLRDESGSVEFTVCIGIDVTEREAARRQLEAERNFSATLFDATPALVIVHDRYGRIVRYNDAAAALAGYAKDELVGRHSWDVLLGTGDDQREARERYAALATLACDEARKRFGEASERVWRLRDGRLCTIAWRLSYLPDEMGKVAYQVASGLDITERRQIEEALAAAEANLRGLLDAISEAVALLDPQGRVLFANEALAQRLGTAVGDMAGRCVYEFLPPEVARRRRQMVEQVVTSGEAIRHVVDTRGERILDNSLYPVFGGNGKVARVAVFSVDITESKHAETQLKLAASVFENTAEGIMITDRDNNIVSVNRAFTDITGYSAEEAIGNNPRMLQSSEYSRDHYRTMWDQILTQGTWQGELWDRRKNGERYYEQLSITTVREPDGNITYYHALIRDVTDRKMAEEALWLVNDNLERLVTERTADLQTANLKLQHTLETLQRAQAELVRSEKLASLGSMVAGVAHELNTPLGNSLTVITALADSARDFATQAQKGALRRSQLTNFVAYTLKAADLVTHNLSRANELIIHFKQVAVDQTSAQRRQFDLNQAIGEIVEMLQPQFKRGAHRVVIDIPEGIRMDSFPGPLGQIVTNLVNNALVHAFGGVQAGVITIRALPPADGKVRMLIADNGCGIAPEQLPRVFDPFFTTRLGQGGSGLGLHIVFRVATRVLGGQIDIASKPGDGTVFTLDLPLSAPAQEAGDGDWIRILETGEMAQARDYGPSGSE